MTTSPITLQASQELAADIIRLVQRQPNGLLRTDTQRAIWGLAILPPDAEGRSRGWVALSILGCALLAPRLRPFVYTADIVPALDVVTDILSKRFKCARKTINNRTLSVFALAPEFGHCGDQVLLLQPSPENLPWLAEPSAPFRAEEDAPLLQPGEWRDALLARRSPADPLQGAILPAIDRPDIWLRHKAEANLPQLREAGDRAGLILTAQLRETVAVEAARVRTLDRLFPDGGFTPPSWLDAPDALIHQVVTALLADQQAGKTVPGPVAPPPSAGPSTSAATPGGTGGATGGARSSLSRRPSGSEIRAIVSGAPASQATPPTAAGTSTTSRSGSTEVPPASPFADSTFTEPMF